jgi:hypothetical protein
MQVIEETIEEIYTDKSPKEFISEIIYEHQCRCQCVKSFNRFKECELVFTLKIVQKSIGDSK